MAIERREEDGGWYCDGARMVFKRRSLFWEGCNGHPVLSLAKEILDHSPRLGWAIVVFGSAVIEQKSLGLDDKQRPARANRHPAAVEGQGSRWYRVEFTTGDVAVIQITERGHWGPEDADVETTVTVATGTVPQPTEAQLDAHRSPPIVVTATEARRAVRDKANGVPVLSVSGFGTLVEWYYDSIHCHTTSVSATPEAQEILQSIMSGERRPER